MASVLLFAGAKKSWTRHRQWFSDGDGRVVVNAPRRTFTGRDELSVHVGGRDGRSPLASPVSYQGVPTAWLPEALRDENPLGIPQRVDGVLRVV
jgi:hypothetical protein